MYSRAPTDLDQSSKALESALAAGQNRPDRLPGLVSIFNHLPKLLFEDIHTLSYLQPRVMLAELSAGRFSQYCPMPRASLVAAVRADKLKGAICFAADCETVFSFIEAALGHDSVQPSSPPSRAATATERNIVRVLFRRLARSLTNAFSLLVDVTFEVEAVTETLEVDAVCRPGSPVVAARLMLEYAGRVGFITIAIPQALLAPIRASLEVAPPSDGPLPTSDVDPDWSRKLNEELARAFLRATAVLDETLIPLGDVTHFRVGSTVELTCKSLSKARLEVDDTPLFWCELGRRDGSLVIRVENEFGDEGDEVFDELGAS